MKAFEEWSRKMEGKLRRNLQTAANPFKHININLNPAPNSIKPDK